jgi:hypothetical protein
MNSQNRKAMRTDIDVYVTLQKLCEELGRDSNNQQVQVNVINISKGGIAFKTAEKLQVGVFYDTIIRLANSERIGVVVRIVWMQDTGGEEFVYGCRFVGISAENEFKIECYQIVDEYGGAYTEQLQ